jgi:membrane-associated phospholipid phosphatase
MISFKMTVKFNQHHFFLFMPLLFIVSINACSAQSPFQKLDDNIMIDIQNTRTPEQTDVALFLSNTYRYGSIGVPAGLFIGGVFRHDEAMRQNALFVASSTALSGGLDFLLKRLVKRRRPFIQNINITPVYRAGSTSFPSGHAAATFSTATALAMAYPKWYVITPAFIWAGSVSYSRMYLGEHYPTDVAAGAFLGAGSALSLSFLKK